MQGLGFRVQDLGFGVWGLGFGAGFRAGAGVWGFRIWGFRLGMLSVSRGLGIKDVQGFNLRNSHWGRFGSPIKIDFYGVHQDYLGD